MSKNTTKTVEHFLKEIEDLKAKVAELKKYESDANSQSNTDEPSELISFSWLENSPVCTKIIDLDFNLQYMSNAGVTKLKIDDIEEFYGKPYPLYFYSDSFKIPMTNALKKAKSSRKPITQEASILDKDGNELWFNSTLIPVNNVEGKLDHYMIVSSDITDRKQAEIKLLESENKLQEALEITNLGTFVFNDSTDFFETSIISDNILGLNKSYKRDIQGWINLVHPEDYESAQKLLDDSNKESVSTEFRIIRPNDNKTIWILGHAKKEYNEKGIRTKITGTIKDISKRKFAETNLQQSELRLREAQSVARIGSFEGDIYKDELWWSEELFNLFGLNSSTFNVTKDNFNQLVHPEDFDEYNSALMKCLESGYNFKKEFRGKHTKDGWRHFETVAAITHDSEGETLGMRGTVQDITDRKEVEKVIKKNQDFNESLLKTTPDIIYVYDLIKQKNVYANDGNLKVLGYTDEEIIAFGKELIPNLLHPDDYKQYINEIIPQYEQAKEGEVIEYENRLKHKNGNWLWLHNKETIFKRKNGKATQIFGIAGDITERKKAEEKLSVAKANLKNTFNVSPSIISKANIVTGYFIEVSPAVKAILGFTQEEFLSKPFTDFIHPDDIQRTIDEIEEKLKGKKVISFENRYLCKDGSYKWIDWQSTAPDENGVVTSVGSDINDKKQVEKDLRSSAERFERWKSSNFIGILQSNSSGDIVDANDTILEMLGYTKKELKDGKLDWTKLTPPEFLHLDELAIKEAEEKGFWTPFEKEYYHKDGHRIPILIGGSLFKETQNEFIVFIVNLTNNKKLLIELEESKEYLDLAIQGSGLGIWDWGIDDNSVKFDFRWAQMLGLNVNEIPMELSTWESRVHPDDLEKCYNDINNYLKGETDLYENVHRMKHADGRWIYILDRGRISEYDKNGKPKRFTGTHLDITESVLNQQTKLDELNRVISSSPSCLKIITKEGTLLDMNKRGLEILSVNDLDEVKGLSIYDVIDENFKKEFIAFNEKICSGETGTLKFVILNTKGENVWVETYAKPYKLSNGEIAHIAITNDITDRINSEKDLKESEELLNITGEIAKIGGWEFDVINKTIKWSKEVKKIHEVGLDFTPDIDTAINFYHPDDRDMVQSCVSKAIEHGKSYDYEARIITKKGNERFVKAIGQPVLKNDKCIRLYGAFQDITERKKIEVELDKYRLQLETENVFLKKEMSLSFNYEDLVYVSDEISNVLTQVEKVSITDATVLIQGETGTGKELIAKAIHNTSNRKDNSLIRVNCAAIPTELIESELFGHIKGSFTGAIDNRIGKFELADGGTLFLDEIGELPLALQPKLLRAIQEGEIEPIGSSKIKKLDVRIIAATNRDLKKEAEEKRFREDLYFRLNVFPISVPPLRKRIEDIPVLIDFFVSKFCKRHGKDIKYISDITLGQMKAYEWPGNVRELENVVERAVIISAQDVLTFQEFDSSPQNKTNIKSNPTTITLEEVQRNHIIKTLNETNWKIDGKNGAAELLDIKPSTLRDRMKKFGIKRLN